MVRVASEISCSKRCPAVRLAISRTPRATGRISRLAVSIKTKAGTSGVGVPSGRRWAMERVGWLRIPVITVAAQSGAASARVVDSWVVGVYVYGRRPVVFMIIIKSRVAAIIGAHFCPRGEVLDMVAFIIFLISQL